MENIDGDVCVSRGGRVFGRRLGFLEMPFLRYGFGPVKREPHVEVSTELFMIIYVNTRTPLSCTLHYFPRTLMVSLSTRGVGCNIERRDQGGPFPSQVYKMAMENISRVLRTVNIEKYRRWVPAKDTFIVTIIFVFFF